MFLSANISRIARTARQARSQLDIYVSEISAQPPNSLPPSALPVPDTGRRVGGTAKTAWVQVCRKIWCECPVSTCAVTRRRFSRSYGATGAVPLRFRFAKHELNGDRDVDLSADACRPGRDCHAFCRVRTEQSDLADRLVFAAARQDHQSLQS